jgi:hypothetical protein
MISTYSVLLMRGWNAALFDDLLRRVDGDGSVVERLIEYESSQ